MDIFPQDTTQPISDDQELAKALAGVISDDQPDEGPVLPAPTALTQEQPSDTPPPLPTLPGVNPLPSAQTTEVSPLPPLVTSAPAPVMTPSTDASGLDGIKKDALNELRPLVDRVNIAAEEKFDIYLMLIRSTDDASLIASAHTAAQGIADEKRKAEALLEIIKEIDYLTRKDQPAA